MGVLVRACVCVCLSVCECVCLSGMSTTDARTQLPNVSWNNAKLTSSVNGIAHHPVSLQMPKIAKLKYRVEYNTCPTEKRSWDRLRPFEAMTTYRVWETVVLTAGLHTRSQHTSRSADSPEILYSRVWQYLYVFILVYIWISNIDRLVIDGYINRHICVCVCDYVEYK